MSTLVTIIHIITSFLIIIAVLLQVGKGASMGSTFGGGGSSALFGSSGPASMLAKVTGVCAVIFMITSLFLTYNGSKAKSSSIMAEVPAVQKAPAPQSQPMTAEPVPAQAPVATTAAVPVQAKPANSAAPAAPAKAPAKAEPQKK